MFVCKLKCLCTCNVVIRSLECLRRNSSQHVTRGGKNIDVSDLEDFDIGRIPSLWGVDLSNKISVHKPFIVIFHSSKLGKSLMATKCGRIIKNHTSTEASCSVLTNNTRFELITLPQSPKI